MCWLLSSFSEVHARLKVRGLSLHSGLVDEMEYIVSMGPTAYHFLDMFAGDANASRMWPWPKHHVNAQSDVFKLN